METNEMNGCEAHSLRDGNAPRVVASESENTPAEIVQPVAASAPPKREEKLSKPSPASRRGSEQDVLPLTEKAGALVNKHMACLIWLGVHSGTLIKARHESGVTAERPVDEVELKKLVLRACGTKAEKATVPGVRREQSGLLGKIDLDASEFEWREKALKNFRESMAKIAGLCGERSRYELHADKIESWAENQEEELTKIGASKGGAGILLIAATEAFARALPRSYYALTRFLRICQLLGVLEPETKSAQLAVALPQLDEKTGTTPWIRVSCPYEGAIRSPQALRRMFDAIHRMVGEVDRKEGGDRHRKLRR